MNDEGGVKDIVFTEENRDYYYLNRGLYPGYSLEVMGQEVLNKKVTLHLANTREGTSNHLAYLPLQSKEKSLIN